MISLTDLVIENVQDRDKRGSRIVRDYQLDLSLPDLPEPFFISGELGYEKLLAVIGQLSLEAEGRLPGRILYLTEGDQDVQRLVISHNGRPAPKSDLIVLNREMLEIAERKRMHFSTSSSGNLIAAQALRPYRGRVRLENIDGGDYTVRTIVEVPYAPDYSK